jgi:putative ABC transport system ATP-binding protein
MSPLAARTRRARSKGTVNTPEWTRRRVLRSAVAAGGRRGKLAASAVFLSGHQAGEALVPVVVGAVIDRATETADVAALLRWLAVLLTVFAALSLSWRMGRRQSEQMAQSAAHDLRMLITGRILYPAGSAGGDRLSGTVVSTATLDAQQVGDAGQLLAFAAAGLTSLTVATVALLRVSGPLTLLVLLGLPPVLVGMRALGRPLERRSAVEQAAAAHAGGTAADLVSGLRVVKGLGAERAAAARYRAVSRASLAASLRAARAAGWYEAAGVLIPGLFLAAVALVAGRLAAGGSITVGELVAVVGLAQFLATPVWILAYVGQALARARASADRIVELLATPPAVTGAIPAAADQSPLLSVQGAALGSIGPLTFQVRAGETLGLVVPDGETAATLLDWLARASDPERGTISLDGQCLSDLEPDSFRRLVTVSPHDAELFEGTVAANVRAAAPRDADVGPALAAASVDRLAAELPDGLDTDVGERGQALSGGQRQRVALARALATDAPVLVLHDPTTAVDPVTEAGIVAGLRQLRRERTTVLVTTSPALLGICDRVVVVDPDRPAEGTHAELCRRHPAYRELVA